MSHEQHDTVFAGPTIGKRLFRLLSTASVAASKGIPNPGLHVPVRDWVGRGFLAVAIALFTASAQATAAEPAAPGANSEAVAVETAAPAPIPLVEVAADAESTLARIRDIQAQSSADRTAETVAGQLPASIREIEARFRETRKLLAQRPSTEMLDSLEAGWWRLGRNLYGWTWDLTRRASKLDGQIADLDELGKKWEQTLTVGRNSEAPPEIVRRIQTVLVEINQGREAIETRRGRLLTMQNRVAAQEARITDAFRLISDAREEVLRRLFIKDSGPVWSPEVRAVAAPDLLEDSRTSFATQWEGLSAYLGRETVRSLLHVATFIIIAALLYRARQRLRARPIEESDRRAVLVFDSPIAMAAVISIVCSWWIYPEAPRLLWATLIAVALVASVIVLRPLVNRDLSPILYALVVFYLIDQVRAATAAVELLPRLLLIGEMAGAMLFLAWLARATRPSSPAPETERAWKTIKVAASVALAVAMTAFVANIAGYVTFANLIGNALVGSACFALILYAVVEIVDGLFTIALGGRPLGLLSTVNRHRPLMRRRARLALQWIAIFLWIVYVLDRLLLRERLVNAVREILTAELGIGSLHVSPGDVLSFGVTVWAAFLVSRFVRFLLDEDVYPRVRLTRGLPYAISTMLHYLILVVGFFAAVAALGFDMTKVTILAGAFSLGVGFGLQNIFNNFISGIILLFERPVKVGDVVQIEDASGVVERIGIRASIIRTTNGSEIIVPNGKLISEHVVNWTLSNRQHGIELPITVAQGTDPSRVIALLEGAAAAHPLVGGDPPPQALVVKLGPDSLAFELRAWTEHIERWMQIRSELAITITAALAAEKIALR